MFKGSQGWFPWFPSRRPHIHHPSRVPRTAPSFSVPPLKLSSSPTLNAPMRYIRFLKPPRVVTVKGTSKQEISCLVTIVSDLGDSFLLYDIQLSAELLSGRSEEIIVWRTVQWSAGMRTLSVTFPLTNARKSSILRVRVGFGSKLKCDQYSMLSEDGACGVLSAWSSSFVVSAPTSEARKLVQRRFTLPGGSVMTMYEETGESIARHLW